MPTIYAIDPGTQCGIAVFENGKPRMVKTVKLQGGSYQYGMRALNLRKHLSDVAAQFRYPIVVAFEQVRNHKGTQAAHAYGAIVGALQEWAQSRDIPYVGLEVPDIKRLATGKGNANKQAMIEAARSRWPSVTIADDNAADALWIGQLAWQRYGDATEGGTQ